MIWTAPVFFALGPSVSVRGGGMRLAFLKGHVDREAMLTTLTAPALTFVFLGVVVGLGIAFVWMLWEIEQVSKPHRDSDRPG
jgi:hypothetical protein